MNCLTARQTLELTPSDGRDSGDPADDNRPHGHFAAEPRNQTLVLEAARHVKGCPTCQTAIRRQEHFDKKLGGMIRDVAVPGNLKERLLAHLKRASRETAAAGGLSDAPRANPTSAVPASGVPAGAAAHRGAPLAARSAVNSRRRRLTAISLAVAACLVVGIGVTWWPAAETVSLEEISSRLAKNDISADQLDVFPHVRGRLAPQLPATMLAPGLGLPARRLENWKNVAVYFFTLPGPNKTTLAGRLAVVPKRLVSAGQLPLATSFLGGPTNTIYKGGYCITAWVEGNFVYVCCLKGAENELHRLDPQQQIM